MKDFIVVIGQVVSSTDYGDRFNINLYKVKAESREEIEEKIKSRTDFWSSAHIDVQIMDIVDLEETSNLRREVEYLGNFWLLPKSKEKG